MLSVTVHITGIQANQDRLTRIKATLEDMTDIMSALSATLLRFFEDTVFVSQGQAVGENWAPLKPATVAEKDKEWPGRGILVRSGEMQQAFYGDIGPNSLFISNKSDHFLYHQLGTAVGPGRGHNIPARRMLAVNDTVEGIIRDEIETGVRAKIDGVA